MSCCDAPGLLPLDNALSQLRDAVSAIDAREKVALTDALGCILADVVRAPDNVPNVDNSAMDGYAFDCRGVKAGDTLSVVGKSFAGAPYTGQVKSGQCVRIMTGATIPLGCNCVVMQENVSVSEGNIALEKAPRLNDNIRSAGNDIKKEAVVIEQGKRLGAIEIGVLASLGIAEVSVKRKLRVAVFSTGDELVQPGQPLSEGMLYDSNRYALCAMLTRLHVDVCDLGHLPDDATKIEQTFLEAEQTCDAIVTSGGVSVGEADFTRDILHKIGDVTFYKVAIKPGKPFAFGRIGKAVFFGLPGNPVSASVTFHQLALPTLRRMAGESFDDAITLIAQSHDALKKRPGRTDFQRGVLTRENNGNLSVRTTGGQSSGALSSMLKANCYIKLEQERGNVEVGEEVTVIPFDSWLM